MRHKGIKRGPKFQLSFLMFLFLFEFILIFPENVKATVQSDSLENILKQAPDDKKAEILNLLVQEYLFSQPEKAGNYAEKALKLAREQKNREDEARALYSVGLVKFYANNYKEALPLFQQSIDTAIISKDDKTLGLDYSIIGYYHEIQSEYPEALSYYRKALAKRQKIHDFHGTAKSLDNIGNIYQYLSNYDSALILYQEAFDIYKLHPNPKGMAELYNNMGIIYYYLSDYEKAIDLFQQSYLIKEKLSDQKGMANSLNNIASIYQMMGNLPEALKNYEKTLKIHQARGLKLNIAVTAGNIGTVYAEMNNDQKSLEYYNISLDNYRETNNIKGIAVTLSNIGDIYSRMGKSEQSLKFYLDALKQQEQIEDKQEIAVTLRRIGDLYAERHDYVEAGDYLRRSLALSKELNSSKEIMDASSSLANTYFHLGKSSQAYEMLLASQNLKDSLFNEEKHRQIVEMQTKFDTERKDNEIKSLKQEKNIRELQAARQKYFIYFIISFLLLIGLIGLFLFSRFRNRQKEHQLSLEMANLEIEQRLLLVQINPHFIFNALGSILNVIQNDNSTLAARLLTKFAKLMRMNLENSRNSSISLEDEVLSLKYYLEIEQQRLDSKFDFSIEISEDLEADKIYLPPMLIQPLVENAILHGIRNKEGKGHIILQFTKTAKHLQCIVEDDGVGRARANELKAAKPRQKKSMGTQLITERLKLLNLYTSTHYYLDPEDLKDEDGNAKGTRVKLLIPLDRDE